MKDQKRTKLGYAVKAYQEGADVLLAACDAELLDRTFRDKERGIKIHVSKEFYHGDVVGVKRLEELMRCATILNLIGKRTVSIAKALSLVDERGVIVIGTVPHAQVVRLLRGR